MTEPGAGSGVPQAGQVLVSPQVQLGRASGPDAPIPQTPPSSGPRDLMGPVTRTPLPLLYARGKASDAVAIVITAVVLLAISTLVIMNNACKSSQHEWCAAMSVVRHHATIEHSEFRHSLEHRVRIDFDQGETRRLL
jgi:hypothetical protein